MKKEEKIRQENKVISIVINDLFKKIKRK